MMLKKNASLVDVLAREECQWRDGGIYREAYFGVRSRARSLFAFDAMIHSAIWGISHRRLTPRELGESLVVLLSHLTHTGQESDSPSHSPLPGNYAGSGEWTASYVSLMRAHREVLERAKRDAESLREEAEHVQAVSPAKKVAKKPAKKAVKKAAKKTRRKVVKKATPKATEAA